MSFMDFLHSVGHLFQNIFSIIKKVVPEQILELAIEKARVAADQFVDNSQRREWVIAELLHVPGVSESVARLAVELAVQHLKADAIDKGATKATQAVQQ